MSEPNAIAWNDRASEMTKKVTEPLKTNLCRSPVDAAPGFDALETILDVSMELGMNLLLTGSAKRRYPPAKHTYKPIRDGDTRFPDLRKGILIDASGGLELGFLARRPDDALPLTFQHGRLWDERADLRELGFQMRSIRAADLCDVALA
jgi:hypothetical protein